MPGVWVWMHGDYRSGTKRVESHFAMVSRWPGEASERRWGLDLSLRSPQADEAEGSAIVRAPVQTLGPECLGSNPGPVSDQLCDLGHTA